MFDVYMDNDCVCGDFKTYDAAARAVAQIITKNRFEFLAGGSDGPNVWGAYKCISYDGFPDYLMLSIRKIDYKAD